MFKVVRHWERNKDTILIDLEFIQENGVIGKVQSSIAYFISTFMLHVFQEIRLILLFQVYSNGLITWTIFEG